MIKILLADDHSIVREGLKRIIEESGEMEIVAEAPDGETAFEQALVKKIESGPFHNISFVIKMPHPVDGIRATVPDLIASVIKPGIPLLNFVFPDIITPRTGIRDDQFREKKQAYPDKNRSYENRLGYFENVEPAGLDCDNLVLFFHQ